MTTKIFLFNALKHFLFAIFYFLFKKKFRHVHSATFFFYEEKTNNSSQQNKINM